MKVVINNCYGGFSLSPLAVKRMAELQGRECYFFKHDHQTRTYIPVSLEDADKVSLFYAFSVPNPNDVFSKKQWASLSDEERKKENELYNSLSINNREYRRDDPLLIRVVEELKEKANGECAKLKIAEVPDGVDWEIEEYDGMEWVAERHRTWG